MPGLIKDWIQLARVLNIHLPEAFLEFFTEDRDHGLAWKFLSAAEAISIKAELDIRFNYPGREWKGIPFARSTVSEDVVCFDLETSPGDEAKVLPIRDWHGPRWEFSGGIKTFDQWLTEDSKGHLT
jgi:hypothetical protein